MTAATVSHPASTGGYRWNMAYFVCGAGLAAWPVAALVQSPGTNILRHVEFFAVSFVFYLAAVVLTIVRGGKSGRMSGRALYLALVWAVLLRLVLLATTPSLSDDVFRYVWDGKVASSGIDPYAYPPAAPELESLRSPLWNGINHKSMSTPYPPVAEALFAAVYRLAPDSLTGMQAAAIVFDLAVVAVLLALLGRLNMDRNRVLIYAWNPLVLVQFAHSGHFDPAMLLPLLGSLLLLAFGQRVFSGISMGVSVLVKLVPAMLGPLFLPAWGVAGTVAAATTVVAGTLPFLGSPALSGVLTEASDARFNDSAGYAAVRILSMMTPDGDSVARTGCSLALVITSLAVAFSLWRRRAAWNHLPAAIYSVVGAFLLLNAVVEPWYLTWILPFLCLVLPAQRTSRWWLDPSWGWLLLTGSVILTDLTYAQSFGNASWVWVRLVEYAPVYSLLALWLIRWGTRIALPTRPKSEPISH